MTAASVADCRGYLAGQRRMIIARSIAGSLAAALQIPFVDDRALTSVLGSGYRRIAASHHIDLGHAAQQALIHGATPPPSLIELAAGEIAFRIAGRAARRAMLAFAAIGCARSASRRFVTMTLFDHYCARLHSGLAIDAATALALRDEIDHAVDLVPGGLALHPFLDRAIDALDRAWRVRVAAGIK